jgi:threonine/homoserine/homoserine lactone efflux protein
MDLSSLLIFAGALLVAAGSPGPSIAALVARVLTHGLRGVFAFLAAMWIGEAIWLGCAVFGLAALAHSFHWAFLVVKYAGLAYLVYLAWKMWTAPAVVPGAAEGERGAPLKLFFTGLSITLGNPKIMVFYMALLPSIIDLTAVTFAGWVELTATMLVVLAVIDGGYALLAARARLMLRTPRLVKVTNRLSAGLMGGAAAAMALR